MKNFRISVQAESFADAKKTSYAVIFFFFAWF